MNLDHSKGTPARHLVVGMLLAASAVWPQAETIDLTGLSLEELMDVRVHLVSRRSEPLGQAPAAVTVITGEDLRRSGAQTIADALRLVPGMQVARIDANKWAIGARGFNSRFANKLLVQVDGRSVYSPFFSGVFWEDQDLMLADIERIEVTRGPGATLWGANAVDGVINIVSRNAADTRGTLAQIGGGMEERATVSLRHGGRAAGDLYYRVHAKGFDRDRSSQGSNPAEDGWRQGRGGFRADWEHDRDQLMVQGALYAGRMDYRRLTYVATAPYVNTALSEIETSGGHVLGHWSHRQSDRSEMALQAYYDWTRRLERLDERRRTLDVDFQHHVRGPDRYDVVWGGSYRTSRDRITGHDFTLSIDPPRRRTHLSSAFVQGDVELVPERLSLSAGSKFEHNSFTGLEIQPGARLRWTPRPRQTVWASVARAVRTPSRIDADARFTVGVLGPGMGMLGLPPLPEGSPPLFIALSGNADFEAETVRALEAGYRAGLGERWLVDVALFRNSYEDLADAALVGTTQVAGPEPYSVMSIMTTNGISGRTWGAEVAVDGRVKPWWRLRAGYTRLELELSGASSIFLEQLKLDATTPTHQVMLHSSMDWRTVWELDLGLRYVDDLSGLGVDDYVGLDVRLARSLGSRYEVALVGHDLLESSHVEFVPRFFIGDPVAVERALFATLLARW